MKTTDRSALYSGDSGNDVDRKEFYRVEERVAGLFLLGIVLFSPLMLSVFDRGAAVNLLGVPVLFIYIFSAWTLLIVLLACAVEARIPPEEPSADDESENAGPPIEIR
jgi:hypothetical protein